MTPFKVACYLAIGGNLAGLFLFAWGYTVMQAPAWLYSALWCVLNGSVATLALRKGKGVAA